MEVLHYDSNKHVEDEEAHQEQEGDEIEKTPLIVVLPGLQGESGGYFYIFILRRYSIKLRKTAFLGQKFIKCNIGWFRLVSRYLILTENS